MNLRQRKYAICMGQLVRMYLNASMCSIPHTPHRIIAAGGTTLGDPRRIDWAALEQKQSLRSLVEDPAGHFIAEPGHVLTVEDIEPVVGRAFATGYVETVNAAKTYTVARKKDGEIVGTFGTEVEAQAIIDKAKAAKKAALVLV